MSQLNVPVVEFTLEKHPNADTLSIAHIKGWQCVVKTQDFENEVLGVYVPIDSIAESDHALLGFLEGKKVRTIKLRKILSQGVLLPYSIVCRYLGYEPKIDENLADALSIRKYEAPLKTGSMFQSGKSLVDIYHEQPDWFCKFTDIENWNNYPSIIKSGDYVVITEKLHGTNSRYGISKDGEIFIGSHNRTLKLFPFISSREQKRWNNRSFFRKVVDYVLRRKPKVTVPPPSVWSQIYYRENFSEVLSSLRNVYPNSDIVVYGEIVGPGIQDLTYGHELEFYAFGLTINGLYIDPRIAKLSLEMLNLKFVPILYDGNFNENLLDLCNGKSELADHIKEGIIIEDLTNSFDSHIGRIILKKISEAYYLRKNGTDN